MITFISPSFTRVFFNWNITNSPYLQMLVIKLIKFDKTFVLIFSHWSQCSMLILVICGGFNSRRFSFSDIFIVLSPYCEVRVRYGNPEVRNTAQQFLSKTRPCCTIEFIESFLFWGILVTYNVGIYFINKVGSFHSLFVIFNCNVFFCIACPAFWDMKKCFVKLTSRLLHSTIH